MTNASRTVDLGGDGEATPLPEVPAPFFVLPRSRGEPASRGDPRLKFGHRRRNVVIGASRPLDSVAETRRRAYATYLRERGEPEFADAPAHVRRI
ncbi:hypothetical protein KM043_001857 [Ampulex compressa]|nr:hypothetical protein KM043_001857 [Ampulex compressa]